MQGGGAGGGLVGGVQPCIAVVHRLRPLLLLLLLCRRPECRLLLWLRAQQRMPHLPPSHLGPAPLLPLLLLQPLLHLALLLQQQLPPLLLLRQQQLLLPLLRAVRLWGDHAPGAPVVLGGFHAGAAAYCNELL